MAETPDRGLLAYGLCAAALRDTYLRFTSRAENGEDEEETREANEHTEIWEHVEALRPRVANST